MLRIFEKIFGDKYDRHMKKTDKFYTNPISEECWNLDWNFVKFMIPRLELFKKEASEIIEYDFSIVDKILEGFKLYEQKWEWDNNIDDLEELKNVILKNNAIVDESMKLFAEHWKEFWW